MIPPKYNFYVGLSIELNLLPGYIINVSGNLQGGASPSEYACSKIRLNGYKYFFVNIEFRNPTSSAYFYDESQAFMSSASISLIDYNNSVIEIPDGAEYIAFRFTSGNDPNFDAKKSTNFVYMLSTVTPHYKDLNKKYAKENGQQFFRVSLDGKITLHGKDFDIVNNSDIEDRLIFIIEKYNRQQGKWLEYYKGEFSKTDCKLDNSYKRCELKTTAIDDYTEIINKYNNTYDLIKLSPDITKINMHKRSLMQVYISGASTVTNLFGGTYWEEDTTEAISDYNTLVNTYHFAGTTGANELEIANSSLYNINGVYAGINGDLQNWFFGTNYYSIRIEKVEVNTGYLYIYEVSSGKDLYKSDEAVMVSFDNGFFPTGTTYIQPRDSIAFTAIEDNGVVSGTCVAINIFSYPVFQRVLFDIDSVSGVDVFDLTPGDFAADNTNFKKCAGLNTGIIACTSRTSVSPTKYGMNDDGYYFTNDFISSVSGLSRPLPISKNSWANASLWYIYEDATYEVLEESLRKPYVLKDSYSIAAVIKALLNEIDPTIKHEATEEYSSFLYGSSMPIVGGTRFYLFITQKTNVLKGNYDQPAQKAEITFEDLMNMLRDCFRCYWYIEDNMLKIEHILFFMNGGSYATNYSAQLDFTVLKDQFNKKDIAYFQSEIEYDKSDLNARYEFSWMDDATELFSGITIDVNSNYVQKDKTEEINVSKFSSDVDFMLFSPGSFSENGFVLLGAVKNGSSYELPIVETSIQDGNYSYKAISQNWYVSWPYLVSFYMYDMPAFNIACNYFSNLLVRYIKQSMNHTISLPVEEDLDSMGFIKTEFGNGKIDEYSVNMNTRTAKVKLVYKPQ